MPVFIMRSHSSPRISVIIPSRDGQARGNVKRLLADLEQQQRIEEAEILLVVGEKPNGHARNVGVDASHGRWLIFVDDDAGLMGTDYLVRLLAPLEEESRGKPIGMTGVATCLPAAANRFQRLQARSLPRTVFSEVEQMTDSDMAHHLCCAVPRAVYEAVGRESDSLETGTDLDLRIRLRGAGYRIVVVPGNAASHPPPENPLAFWRKHFWYGTGKVELDRLHPNRSRDRIGTGRMACWRYLLRAVVTFPLRTIRLERAAPWSWRPLLALADLARKVGYVQAFRWHLRGQPAGAGTPWLSSKTLAGWLSRTTRRAPVPPAAGAIRRLLVVQTAGLGDALAMQPLLRSLRRHFPMAEMTGWVSRAGAARALQLSGVMDRVVQWDLAGRSLAGRLYRKARMVLWLRRRRFDLAVVNYISSTTETALLMRLGGVSLSAGYEDGALGLRRFQL
ncbi:MAG: glycosyltransferase, partial [Acidobacteriota bacterium]